ncbi:MAG TPA: CPBP family intramembrane glutamic endopeptidase [Acidimicrobiales bacterium]|nr:CPBP family intramembrane glutamic endopeptidase [Acidimicrobiales bacterium]
MATAPVARDVVPDRRTLSVEVWIVLALSLGASALYAVLDLAQDVSSGRALRQQTAVINASVTANSTLNLLYQLLGIAVAVVPVVLVVYLLGRSGESAGSIGLDAKEPGREVVWGAALAAVIGGAGLALYIGSFYGGLDLKVVPTNLPPTWWRIPVLLLAAVQYGLLEEVVICGYLLHRLQQIGWRENRSLVTSALLRGSYHLYQGAGGFVGNLVMGLIFGRLYQRQGRLGRLVLAHSLIDAGALVGYVVLKGKVSWLP